MSTNIRSAFANAPTVGRAEVLSSKFDIDAPHIVYAQSMYRFKFLLRTLQIVGLEDSFNVPDLDRIFVHESQHRNASEKVGGRLIGIGFRAQYIEDDESEYPHLSFFHKATYPRGILPLQRAAVAVYPYDPSLTDILNAQNLGFDIQDVANLAYINNHDSKPFVPMPLSTSPSPDLLVA